MKMRLYAIVALMLAGAASYAQDFHFSQFYSSPLTLNPALTGNFNGLIRASFIYRNQWPTLNDNGGYIFSTPSVSVDASLLRNKLKNGSLGVGLVFLNDQQASKTITNNEIMGSVAYNMTFGPRSKFQLGVGLQGGVLMTKLNTTNLQFDDGFNPDLTYNSSASVESLNNSPKPKGLFNIGIFAKYEFLKGMRVYAGYSFNNATQYKQDWLLNSIQTYDIPFRHTLHGGFEFDYHDKMVFIPGVLMQHTPVGDNETEFGLTVGFHLVRNPDPLKRVTLYAGLWDRVNNEDALIPKIGLDYKGFKAGFAYDIALTQQRADAAQSAIGGGFAQAFEVTVAYIFDLTIPKEDHYLFNPRY